MSGEVVLRLDGVTKRFGELTAVDGVSLDLHAGEIVGLLGENGAGKTTLTSIVFGHLTPDAGSVAAAGPKGLDVLPVGSPAAALAAGIGMVHQHFTLADNLTVIDNVTLGTDPLWRPWRRRDALRRLDALMQASGLAVASGGRVGDLSVGERQRVEILKALYRGARVLVLDEPTAVLAPPEAERLFVTLERLAAGGMTIVFISHKLREVMRLCHRAVVLRRGRKVADLPVAGSSDAKLAEAMVGRAVDARLRPAVAPGRSVLRLEGIGMQGLQVDRLEIRRHEVVGIAGVSGNGQQPLSRLIAGIARPDRGTIAFLEGVWPGPGTARVVAAGIGRVPEDRQRDGLVADLSIAENLALERRRDRSFQRLGILRRGALDQHAARVIDGSDVRCDGPDQAVGLLSGGNAQKLVLARALAGEPELLLADQPTRGLDVGAVADVHARLLDARARGAAILLISEDLDEIMTLADRVAVLYRGRLGDAVAAGSLTAAEIGLMMGGQRHLAA